MKEKRRQRQNAQSIVTPVSRVYFITTFHRDHTLTHRHSVQLPEIPIVWIADIHVRVILRKYIASRIYHPRILQFYNTIDGDSKNYTATAWIHLAFYLNIQHLPIPIRSIEMPSILEQFVQPKPVHYPIDLKFRAQSCHLVKLNGTLIFFSIFF